MNNFVNSVSGRSTRNDAVKAFLEVLDKHEYRIKHSMKKMEDIYSFKTPDSPYFEFGITSGFKYEESSWLKDKYDRKLDAAIQNIAFNLEVMPKTDYVPAIMLGSGFADIIPSMFGVEFERTREGAIINKNYYFDDADCLVEKLEGMPEIDIMEQSTVKEMLEYMDFLIQMTEGRIDMAYPQMQGPFSNVVRFMPQDEALCATISEPEAIKGLIDKIWRIATDIQKAIINKAGSSNVLRARARFYQPKWIKGLLVEDYISVLRPEVFLELTTDAYNMMYSELGPIFQHTCGPIIQSAEIFKQLPGLVGFETAFIRNQSKTTTEIVEAKNILNGKVVMNSFELPFGEPVQDMENFTHDWIWMISEGGGIAIRASGTVEYGLELINRLGL